MKGKISSEPSHRLYWRKKKHFFGLAGNQKCVQLFDFIIINPIFNYLKMKRQEVRSKLDFPKAIREYGCISDEAAWHSTFHSSGRSYRQQPKKGQDD